MKKIITSSLCAAALLLTACDQKTPPSAPPDKNVSSQQSNNLSHKTTQDIATDLQKIETLSDSKTQQALDFQKQINEAAQSQNQTRLQDTVNQMQSYVQQFNLDLDGLALKSSEVAALREKIKQSNLLGLALAQEGIKTAPDQNVMNDLQSKASQLQQSLLQDLQQLEQQAKSK